MDRVRLLAQNLKIETEQGSVTLKGLLEEGPLGGSPTIGTILSKAIPIILGFAGIGLLLMIISGGFTLMTGGGDAKKMEVGKQRLTHALVGFLVIFAAYWLVQLAGFIFGIPEFKTLFPW